MWATLCALTIASNKVYFADLHFTALLPLLSIRSLLGRHFMHCRDAGSLREREMLSGALSLASIDHVLILGEDILNEVAMRAGLGWNSSLSSKKWRW